MPKAGKSKATVVLDDLPPSDNIYHNLHYALNANRSGHLNVSSGGVHTNLNLAPSNDLDPPVNVNRNNSLMDTDLLNIPPSVLPSTSTSRNLHADDIDDVYMTHLAMTASDDRVTRVRAKGDEALHEWKKHIDMALQEIITLEGRGFWVMDLCVDCCTKKAEIECVCCNDRKLRCGDCTVRNHQSMYLHHIRKWNGSFYERISLAQLGLRVQLGHAIGDPCFLRLPAFVHGFTILAHNGIHIINLDFCQCGAGNQLPAIQLLRARLFPATFTNPRTAATFETLDLFEMLSYQSKITGFEFYHTLSRMTDNTGTAKPPDKYKSCMRMIRLWRHIGMLKRAARGHDPAGVVATKEGECAVLCPACPIPSINMKPGWENELPELAFIHAQFVALDANFRLKRKNVSSDEADPGLTHGWAYFVEEKEYKQYLQERKEEKEPKSSCSRHQAVNLADTKPGLGHSATGTASVECARHNMKRPTSVGDLQYGERYCNMDYLFRKSIGNLNLKKFNVSYDIACQWSINLEERIKKLDTNFTLFREGVTTFFLVPKFHLPAHIASCQTKYSFNWTAGVGRTDGESPERGWSNVNPLAPSTKEMGPASRRETLDSHFGDYNWSKITNIGPAMKRKFLTAACDMVEYTLLHLDLCKMLGPAKVDEWTALVKAWESNPSLQNPFEPSDENKGPTLASARLQLALKEATDITAGKDISLDDSVTPMVLISTGVDLEIEQRALKVKSDELWDHAQDRQRTKYQLRANALRRKIQCWWQYQQLYYPSVVAIREKLIGGSAADIAPQNLPLCLPSTLSPSVPVDPELRAHEWELREGQAFEALEKVRNQLRLRACLSKFKQGYVRGQAASTRAQKAIAAVQARINSAAEDYRASREALLSLSNNYPLVFRMKASQLKELKADDLREISSSDPMLPQRNGITSQGYNKLSWIWHSLPDEDENDPTSVFYQEQLRIEFCKSRARAARFTEEILILREEIQRVIRFFQRKTNDWLAKTSLDAWKGTPYYDVGGVPDQVWAEGQVAYAQRQAMIYCRMTNYCVELWSDLPGHLEKMNNIIANPDTAKPEDFLGQVVHMDDDE